MLPPVTVTADVCVTGKNLEEHPQLQTLWQQARRGASVRTEVMARYRYHVLSHEESYELKADGPTAPGTIDQSYMSDPKWAVKNAARNRTQRLSRGYYGPSRDSRDGFYVPNELDILHEDFLKAHCFVQDSRRYLDAKLLVKVFLAGASHVFGILHADSDAVPLAIFPRTVRVIANAVLAAEFPGNRVENGVHLLTECGL